MPDIIRQRVLKINNWMTEANDALKGGAHSIDDFVKRNEDLKVIQKGLGGQKKRF